MNKILVTGGCGYIGSHTIVDLVKNGYEVISIDDMSRGHETLIYGASKICEQNIKNYRVNLCNLEDTRAVFEENPDIIGIIHFAAFKSVNESVSRPLDYFSNNITSLINILRCAKEYNILNIVFSSSCSVYGNATSLPVTEATPLQSPESPYARTKVMGEDICSDFTQANPLHRVILLRYFNPVGAHESSLIGELNDKPENLVPVITQTAIGKRASMDVFGNDYDTRDGSCIRDYIHVMDIAAAHTKAITKSIDVALPNRVEIFNLGTGNGVTVLELIESFEAVAKVKLNYKIAPRRAGDVIAVYADNSKAKQMLGWELKYGIKEMMQTAWDWELKLDNDRKSFLN